MGLEKLVEGIIQEAMANGEFDNLRGKGKPLNLDEYFNTPEHLRLGYSLLKSNGFLPEELVLFKEMQEAREALAACEDPAERARLQKDLNFKTLRFEVAIEAFRKRRRSR